MGLDPNAGLDLDTDFALNWGLDPNTGLDLDTGLATQVWI